MRQLDRERITNEIRMNLVSAVEGISYGEACAVATSVVNMLQDEKLNVWEFEQGKCLISLYGKYKPCFDSIKDNHYENVIFCQAWIDSQSRMKFVVLRY